MLLVLASGGVRSIYPVYPDSSGVAILPERTILTKNDDVYLLTRRGNTYYFDDPGVGYESLLFRDLGNGYHVAQALVDDEKGYLYALAKVETGSLKTYVLPAGKFADRNGLRVAKRMSDDTVQIEDWRQMDQYHQVAARHLGEANDTTYRVIDAGDPAEAETVAALVSKAEEKRKSRDKAKPRTAEIAVPSSSGLWSLDEVVDPMTDARRLRITGVPASFEGAREQPSMRISCRKDGLVFSIYWGTQLSRLYETSALVVVDVRFDSNNADRLGWVGSQDWMTTYNPDKTSAAFAQIGQSIIDAVLQNKQVILIWDQRRFHRNMINGSRLVVRSSSMSGQYVTLVFDLAGYSELSQAFPSHCK